MSSSSGNEQVKSSGWEQLHRKLRPGTLICKSNECKERETTVHASGNSENIEVERYVPTTAEGELGVIFQITCPHCNAEWFIASDGSRRGTLKQMKKYLKSKKSPVSSASPSSANNVNQHHGHPELTGMPRDKIVCNTTNCTFVDKRISTVQVQSNKLSYLQLTCSGCDNTWYVDPQTEARRKDKKDMNKYLRNITKDKALKGPNKQTG